MDKDSERRVESKMKKVFFVLMKRRCVKKVRKALGHTLLFMLMTKQKPKFF